MYDALTVGDGNGDLVSPAPTRVSLNMTASMRMTARANPHADLIAAFLATKPALRVVSSNARPRPLRLTRNPARANWQGNRPRVTVARAA